MLQQLRRYYKKRWEPCRSKRMKYNQFSIKLNSLFCEKPLSLFSQNHQGCTAPGDILTPGIGDESVDNHNLAALLEDSGFRCKPPFSCHGEKVVL